MRSHADIAGGAEMIDRLARLTGASVHTVRSWVQRNRIPPEYWTTISEGRIATLEELAAAAANNPRAKPATDNSSAQAAA